MTETSAKSEQPVLLPTPSKWTYFHFVVIILLMFGFPLLPAPQPVTPVGMRVAGVFFGLLYGWSACGMLWPSLIGLLAMGFSGLYRTAFDAISAGIGNSNVLFCILTFIMVEALNDCGLIKMLNRFLLTRPGIKGHVWRLVTVLLAISFALASIGQVFGAMFLVWQMWYAIFDQCGYEPGEKFPTLMVIATVLVMCAGGVLWPFTNVPYIILSAYASICQETINFFRYVVFIIPIAVLMFAEIVLVIKYIFKPDTSKLQNIDLSVLVDSEAVALTKRQKLILTYFLIWVVMLFLPGILSKSWLFTKLLLSLGNAGVTLIIVIAMILTPADGKSIFNFNELASRSVSWDIFFFLAVILMMATAISNPATGISDFLKLLLRPMLAIHSPYLFVAIFVAIAFILTNFMNNMVVGILLLPLVVVAGQMLDVNCWALIALIIVAVNFSVLTPAASPVSGILFGNKKWINYRKVFVYVFTIFLAWGITLLVIGIPYANLIF